MSISDKFRTWVEMDTEDDFIQYLERLVSGDPALSEASTASSRSPGINRPLARLAHNTDAVLDALIATKTMIMTADGATEDDPGTYIDFGSVANTLEFSGDWKFLSIAPVEDGALNVGFEISNDTISLGSNNVVYAIVDRSSGSSPTASLQVAADFDALRASMLAGSTPLTDYEIIGYSWGSAGNKNVIHLLSGVSIQNGERLSGLGVHSLYGQALIQRAHSGYGATIQGGDTITWEESTRTLTWSDYLYVYVPGMATHRIEPGSHSFSTDDTYLYFVPDREDTSSAVDVSLSDLVEKRKGHYSITDRIDIAGHDGVDLILIGLRAPSTPSGYFVFANGRVVVDGAQINLDHSSVETMSFTDAAGTTTHTKGNVELKVTGTDGLELTTTTPTDGAGEATISLSPLWHDRFLTSLMSSPAETVVPTRVIFDSTNPDGDVFLYTSDGDHEIAFRVPGYDSTTFYLKLKGDTGYPGITLGDGELAWIVLPDRNVSTTGVYFYVFSGSATSTSIPIQTGAISDFPEDDPNAFIIAYKWVSSSPTTEVYHFLGVQGLRDKTQWPVFSGETYRSIPVSYTHLTLPTTPYV